MASEKQKAAPIELAKPINIYWNRHGNYELVEYKGEDIAAERERWQAAVANADKSGYARGFKDGLANAIGHQSDWRDKNPQKKGGSR